MHTIHDINDPKTQGLIVLLAGIVIRYIINVRKFKRRGISGLQHFNNYFTAVITLFSEWLFKWVGNGLFIWGLFRLLFG